MITRRAWLKKAGLFVPFAPRIVRAQAFSFKDLAFMGQQRRPNGLLNGLTSYWKFDFPSSTADSKGSNTLTLSGGTDNQPGKINTCVGFGAVLGQGFSINPAPSNLRGGTGISFTISLWLLTSGAQQTNTGLFTQWSSSVQANQSYLLQLNGGNIIFAIRTATNTYPSFSWTTPADGPFHHIIASFDSGSNTLSGYLDGADHKTAASTSATQASSVAIGICNGDIDGGNDSLNGKIDECGFWNRVLNSAEVASLYNGGAGQPFSAFTT